MKWRWGNQFDGNSIEFKGWGTPAYRLLRGRQPLYRPPLTDLVRCIAYVLFVAAMGIVTWPFYWVIDRIEMQRRGPADAA